MGSDSNCQSTRKWLQPKAWVVCYPSPMAGLAPALLDKWKIWVNYLKGETTLLQKCLHFWYASTDFRWFGDQKYCAQKKFLVCSLQQVRVICFILKRWHGVQPDVRVRVCSCHPSDQELWDVFLLHAALSSSYCRERFQGYPVTVVQNFHSKMMSLLQVMCVPDSALQPGLCPTCLRVTLVCLQTEKHCCWCTMFRGNGHLIIVCKGEVVISNNLFMTP